MGSVVRTACLFLGIGAAQLLPSGSGFCQDWPQWRGPNRDGVVHGVTAPAKWPQTLREEWQVPVGDGFSSSPVLVGRNVYVFTRQKGNELVLCADLVTGTERWRSEPYPAPYKWWAGEGPLSKGPRSTPTVAGGRIYTAGVSGVISCLDAKTGRLVWRKEPKSPPPYGGPMSPLVADGLCIVRVGSDEKENGLTAFDVATGEVKWRFADGSRPGYGSPILVELAGARQVVAVTGQDLLGLSVTTGRKLWGVRLDAGHQMITPLQYKDLILFASDKERPYALRLGKGESGVAAKKVWKGDGPTLSASSPVIEGHLLFGMSPRKRGIFFCLDADSGKTIWESNERDGVGYASILNAGSVLLFLTNKGRLLVVKSTAAAYEPIAEYRVSDTETWAHPVFLGDRILIRDATTLRSFRIEQEGK